MSERQAFDRIRDLRWPDSEPKCPHCDHVGAWTISAKQRLASGRVVERHLFKCQNIECRKQFTITSGTLFHRHKMSLTRMLFLLFEFTRGAKGRAALDQVFNAGADYKNTFVFQHRLRRAISAERRATINKLSGEVEADLVFIGGKVRDRNKRHQGKDRRRKEWKSPRGSGVLVMRERGEQGRTLTFRVRDEADAVPIIQRHLVAGSRIYVDGDLSFDILEAHFVVEVIVHNHEYARWADDLAINTNQAESYNSRLRRAERGIHHRISGSHLLDYTDEMAWREDFRRDTAGQMFNRLLTTALNTPPDRRWVHYWRGSGR